MIALVSSARNLPFWDRAGSLTSWALVMLVRESELRPICSLSAQQSLAFALRSTDYVGDTGENLEVFQRYYCPPLGKNGDSYCLLRKILGKRLLDILYPKI